MSNKTTTNQELSKNEYLIALINDLNDKLCTHINLLYVYRTLESELEALIL